MLQFSPNASTGALRMRMRSRADAWSTASLTAGDVGFLRSWFEQNRDFGELPSPGTNWGAISGLALCFALSAGFWTGILLFAERIWK